MVKLNEANIFKYPSTLEIYYAVDMYRSTDGYSPEQVTGNNLNGTSGRIALWYDSGSILTTAPTRR